MIVEGKYKLKKNLAENIHKGYTRINTRAVPLPFSGDVHKGRVFYFPYLTHYIKNISKEICL